MRLMAIWYKIKIKLDERSRWRAFMASAGGGWGRSHYMPFLVFAGLASLDLVKLAVR